MSAFQGTYDAVLGYPHHVYVDSIGATMKQLRWVSLCCTATLLACTISQPVDVAAEPAGVAAFLAAHHPADLQVTDSAGHARWLHNPRLDGDGFFCSQKIKISLNKALIPT